MDQQIQPISLGACIKPFPCVVLVYAESRQDFTSNLRKRIIPLRKGPLTDSLTLTVTVDHLTQASEQLLERHVHHLASVPQGKLLKILGVIAQLIRGADVDTAANKTESILSSATGFSSSQSTINVVRSNFTRKVVSADSLVDKFDKKSKKRVSFHDKPQVQHFTPNSSSDSSESEQISSIDRSHIRLPVKQLIQLPALSIARENGKSTQADDEKSDSKSLKRQITSDQVEDENEQDEFDDASFEGYEDSENMTRENKLGKETIEKREEKVKPPGEEEGEEVGEDDVTTEEVTSDLTEQLEELGHSDRKEAGQIRGDNVWTKSNESLKTDTGEARSTSKSTKVIETTFSWNLDSDDEEFVF